MTRHIESSIQINCVKWFRLQYPKYAKLLIAVPNGGSRNRIEASIMKGEGVTAGASDLILLLSRKGFGSLCIEMKTKEGTQSKAQKEWQEIAEVHGNKYVLCRDIYDFKDEIEKYLNPL